VDETGWGAPEHLWVVRSIRVDVVAPPLADDRVELRTWSSGRAALAAARRMSLEGDRGGRVELDSVWIHLDADAKPARIDDFGVYAESTQGRAISTRLDHRHPLDAGDSVELVESSRDGTLSLAFEVEGVARAVALVTAGV
jgi:acyl-ACP thioesterase-like protein